MPFPSGGGRWEDCPVLQHFRDFCGGRWWCSLCYSSFKQTPRGQIQLEFSPRRIKSIVSVRRCILFSCQKKTRIPVMMLALPSRILRPEFTAFMFSSVPVWHLKLHSFPSPFRGLCYLKRSLKISDIPGSYSFPTISTKTGSVCPHQPG